jgi:hypothetical protein
MDVAGADRLSFLDAPPPPGFVLEIVPIAARSVRPYAAGEWHDALVVVERGGIELETLNGERRRFGCGAVLSLARLPLRALHNPGRRPAVLVRVTRAG